MNGESQETELIQAAAPAIEIVPRNGKSISRLPQDSDLLLTPLMDIQTAQNRLEDLQKFVKAYLHEEEDYGRIPGTPKPTLYKPGADKLCDIYGLADTYIVTNRTEDWTRNLFDYEIECRLISKRTGQLVSSGFGSCNSFEAKYRWREQKRKCPKCGKETIIKGKALYGGGWICWSKPGKSDGCGAKFSDGDKSIEGQAVERVQNEDLADVKNTILKMAKKRAKVDAVLAATRSSGIFTQDIEDTHRDEEGSIEAQKEAAQNKINELRGKVKSGKKNAAEQSPQDVGATQDVEGLICDLRRMKTPQGQEYRLISLMLSSAETIDVGCFVNPSYPGGSTLFSLIDLAWAVANEKKQPVPARFKVAKFGNTLNVRLPEKIANVSFDAGGIPMLDRSEQ